MPSTPIRHGSPLNPNALRSPGTPGTPTPSALRPRNTPSSNMVSTDTKPATTPTPAPAPPAQAAAPAGAPPVIPTSWLAPDEQRRLVLWTLGLVETLKVWDLLSPILLGSNATATRLSGPWSALGWGVAEIAALAALNLLRITGLAPGGLQLGVLAVVVAVWNAVCLMIADPHAVFSLIPGTSLLFGPTHLGEEGLFWGWTYWMWHVTKRMVFGEPDHIEGMHIIRLLPYSTATLNPLSLTYCLPPGSREPIFIPVVFNNSNPESITYSSRTLDGHGKEVRRSVPASQLKRPVNWQARLTDDDDEEEQSMGELVSLHKKLDIARLHSVRPAESLSVIPPDLSGSESLLFLTVTEPSIITLSSVLDKRGDRFNIAPHHEAVIIECPTGGDFVGDEDEGKKVVLHRDPSAKPQDRCIGAEEILQFQARGVAPLKVAWRSNLGGVTVDHGVVEGIDDSTSDDDYFRRDRVSRTHVVPLRIAHKRTGESIVQLTSVVDALGNTYAPSGRGSSMSFNVLNRRSVMFSCPRPLQLLVNGTQSVPLRVDGKLDSDLSVTYAFINANGEEKRYTEAVTSIEKKLPTHEPGLFKLLEVGGACPGTVLEPSTCQVQLVPPPRAEMEVQTLHECAMDVGVTITFEFTGTPPFHVHWTEQRKGERAVERRERFDMPGGQVELRPEKEGKYQYQFLTLSDAHYTHLPLNQKPIEQVVHPPASVDIRGATQRTLHACSGDNVDVELEVKGNAPLQLTYRTTRDHRSANFTVPIKAGKQSLNVPVPKDLNVPGASGKLVVTLVSVEDGNGCVKRLPPRVIEVDVDRATPTARFGKAEDALIVEGETVEVPLRLTGKPPYDVVYTLNGKAQKPISFRQSNPQLRLTEKGIYALQSVKDAFCGGEVDDASFGIDYKARPKAFISESDRVTRRGETYTHQGLCAGDEDAVSVQFTGASPFQLEYKYTQPGKHAKTNVLKSAQAVGVVHLATAPGQYEYAFTSVKDAHYSSTPVSFTLKHSVHARPRATIEKGNTLVLCRDTPLKTDARVKLLGVAPFQLTIGVRAPASADVREHTFTLDKPEWNMAVPDTVVSEVGRYELTLISVADASGCPSAVEAGDVRATSLDVVETARVVPLSHDEDRCVGDTIDFLLQGRAPWLVEYEWVGKQYEVTANTAKFSREADRAGEFAITSVALKDRQGSAQCKRTVSDLRRRVHPLPSAKIQTGVNSLRVGDAPAVFSVSFSGTAPFSFTYTRSETVGGKSRVMETQTITDIWADSYAISSSAPGEYAVTSVSDNFCRFPPLSGREA